VILHESHLANDGSSADLGVVTDHGAHPDDGAIFDRGIVDHGPVAHSHSRADAGAFVWTGMNDDALFDGGFIANLDRAEVAAQDGAMANVATLADDDFSNDLCRRCDAGCRRDDRPMILKCVDRHPWSSLGIAMKSLVRHDAILTGGIEPPGL
jgi:hypothetical protein